MYSKRARLVLVACFVPLALVACGRGSGSSGLEQTDAQPLEEADAGNLVADPVCGNGIREGFETCDPPQSCPTTCEDGLACTVDTLVGSPESCDVRCERESISDCANGDGCCAPGCVQAEDDDCLPYNLTVEFAPQDELRELGSVEGLPPSYGGLAIHPDDPNTLLIGGSANQVGGGLYAVPIARDPQGHIESLAGAAVRVANAPYNDGGIIFLPNDLMVLARWPANGLNLMFRTSVVPDHVIDLASYAVASSVAGLALVPSTHPGAGRLKAVSWSGGEWYDLVTTPTVGGLFDLVSANYVTAIGGGPEGITYVPLGSPFFDAPSVLVSEWSAGTVSTYEVDSAGDPILDTRREFIIGLSGAEGATIDPLSGDFLFSTFGGGDRIVAVRGFAVIE